ncbi:MAG: right-handed parallel beta-helix repeat-containing protein [Planctomycetes bacterium]|nr:right-handed parallel beta-helix repeat-containing protein [Planctomycetota bacterium]
MKATVFLALLFILAASAPAATRRVPDEYLNIQAAIDACTHGDTVIVAPGTYTGQGNRDIDFKGKAITVRSTDPNDPATVAATIIDCNGTEEDPHRGFHFHNDEGANSVLAGFTLRNGFATNGGGTLCNESSPTIANCTFLNNSTNGRGGALYNHNCSPTIVNCLFSRNSNITDDGGGIYNLKSSPVLTGCTFSRNTADSDGGAIYSLDSDLVLTDCAFTGNSTRFSGGAMCTRADDGRCDLVLTNCTFTDNSASYGGGMWTRYGRLTLTDCTFTKNQATYSGGGMRNADSTSVLTNCIFRANSAQGGGGTSESYSTLANCLYVDNHAYSTAGASIGAGTVTNCVFIGNSSECSTGGLGCGDGESVVTNCTIAGNSSGGYGRAGIGGGLGRLAVVNCIVWDNRDRAGASESAQISDAVEGLLTVDYCCIQGWTGELGGIGNTAENPEFVYPAGYNYHLLSNSPCINAGLPDSYDGIDMDGEPRMLDGRVDIGADEFSAASEPLIGVHPKSFGFAAHPDGGNPETQILTIRNLGADVLDWLIVEDCPWLNVAPQSGQSTGNSNQVTLSVDSSTLSSGLYNTELVITAEGVINSPWRVQVTLQVFDDDGTLHVPSEYETIQAAIDTALDGQSVILAPGTYTGDGNREIDFKGKAITVRSQSGPESCVIDCNANEYEPHWAFTFNSGEDANSVISGFTITNGYHKYGGGIHCYQAGPSISGCVLTGNYATWGGGMYNDQGNPSLIDCTFKDNDAHGGAGIHNKAGSPMLTECTFRANHARAMYNGRHSSPILTNCEFIENDGGGVENDRYTNPIFTNCKFIGNSAGSGGALINRDYDTPTLINCLFLGNASKWDGGAMHNTGTNIFPTLINCTLTGNSGGTEGGAISNWDNAHHAAPTLVNCILWGNSDSRGTGESSQIYRGEPVVDYCCIQGWTGLIEGTGNISSDPCFALAGEPYLSAESSCIDAGTNSVGPNLPETDLDGNPRIMNGNTDPAIVVDMGAYEYNPARSSIALSPLETTFSYVRGGPIPDPQTLLVRNCGGQTLDWETFHDCNWLDVLPPNGHSSGQIDEVILSVEPNSLPLGTHKCTLTVYDSNAVNNPRTASVTLSIFADTIHVPEDIPTIQDAIDHVLEGGTVIVADGTYRGPGNRDIDFLGKAITVRSENGPEKCIVDCDGKIYEPHRGFHFHNGENANSVLSGFTIINGYGPKAGLYRWGPGFCGGAVLCNAASPTISGCVLVDNSANYGGAIYAHQSSSSLTRCVFSGNTAEFSGAGLYNSESNLVLTNCLFDFNRAMQYDGGGIGNYQSTPVLANCTFCGNAAARNGGGLSNSFHSDSTLANCLLWYNTAVNGPQISTESTRYASHLRVLCSNVQDGLTKLYINKKGTLTWGPGNIEAEPCFLDLGHWADVDDLNIIAEPNDPNAVAVSGDYHLKSQGWRWDTERKMWTWDDITSRCIDAGNPGSPLGDEPLSVPADPNNDWGVNVRINMGAYGGTGEASMPPYDWALLTDLNNDGIVNGQDFAHAATDWSTAADEQPGDLNRDGVIDFADLALFADDWLKQTTWHK